jgi:cation transport regulator ChaC
MKIQDLDTVYYFAYGHNTYTDTMTDRAPSAEFVGVGVLHNFQLSFHKYANIQNHDGSQVQGVVWRITRRDLNILDHDEGLHEHYARIPVEVHMQDHRVIEAMAYIMEPSYMPGVQPDAGYVRDVGRGYQQHGISLRQLQDGLSRV